MRRRSGTRTLALALAASVAAPAARAQITSETVVNNHGILETYRTPYEPGAGTDRVVLVIVFSEYRATERSAVTTATLGGVALRPFGTRENRDANSKNNRMTAFYLPEAELPGGTPELFLRYGPDQSSSLVYLATALNIRQDVLSGTGAVFVAECVGGKANPAGRIAFAPIAADPADLVFSFAGTGKNSNFTDFLNGAEEFLDERVSGPGFSLAGGLQSPQTPATIAGEARLSQGCQRRPVSMQVKLRPLGTSGVLGLPTVAITPDGLAITVTDADRNLRTGGVDRVTVTVVNPRTGQTETLTLFETGPDTGVFTATLPLSNDPSPGAGTMSVRDTDLLDITYDDILTDSGGTQTTTAQAQVRDPATLTATKTVTLPPGGYGVPGQDVSYAITVTNEGTGRADGGSLFLVDALPASMTFLGPVTVTGHPGIDFDAARDVRFAPAGAIPGSLGDCPDAAPGPAAAYLCIAPQGTLPPGDPDPSFTASFPMRIR